MNMSGLVNMILNRVIRALVNKGVNAGMNRLSRKGKGADQTEGDGTGPSVYANATNQRVRQVARLTRRIGR